MYEYIIFRDEEIIKIRNKNIEKKICKCYKIFNRNLDYYFGYGTMIGMCNLCKIDLNKSIKNYLKLRAEKKTNSILNEFTQHLIDTIQIK